MKTAKFIVGALLLCTSLHAQVIISQTLQDGAGGDGNNGQSFTPGVHTSGTFTTSSAYLTQFTFVVSATSALPNNNAYLLIYSGNLSNGAVSGSLLDVSTNTQNWATIGRNGTVTFDFAGNVALDVSTTYIAVFSSSPVSILDSGHGVQFHYSDVYAGGVLFDNGNYYAGGGDAEFTATFAAVPEPSTYAALFGAAALGFAVWRRRARA